MAVTQEQIDRLEWVESLVQPLLSAVNDFNCSMANAVQTGKSLLANEVDVDPAEIEAKCTAQYLEKLTAVETALAACWRPS